MRILVADDDALSRVQVGDTLRAWGHDVECVEDGEAAWERIRERTDLELVVSDWVMPRLTGPELCRRVRELGRTPHLPIVLITSLGADRHAWEGVEAGADAYLPKPVQAEALRAQLRVLERMRELEQMLHRRVRHLEEAQERIRADRQAAAAVQRSHLPSCAPSVPGVDFAWAYDACHDVGGDMFNVFRVDESHMAVYVLDVSGHGTPAALLSVSMSRALAPVSQQGGIVKRSLPEPPYYQVVGPAEVAGELNRRFQLVEESGHFCTLIYGLLNLEDRVFRYACAGHPGPIHGVPGRGADGFTCQSHDAVGNVPIGVLPDPGYEEGEIQLVPGSLLLLYTDGAPETRSPDGREFGTDRLLEALADSARRREDVRQMVRSLRGRLERFADGGVPADDLTMVGIGVRP